MRIEAESGDELLERVRSQRIVDPSVDIVADVPAGLDEDEQLSLCAVLAVEGVASITGVPDKMARRCLATFEAIASGEIGSVDT